MATTSTLDNSLDFLRGSEPYIASLNAKLYEDMQIYKTRPYLNSQERAEHSEFIARPGHNNIMSVFCFNEDGKYLPEAYNAPYDILKMLYPLTEIISDERRGTIVIDREQYHPNLRQLSYFIYMVDEELYDYYRYGQNFRGDSVPTFMFNRKEHNGIRVFRNHFDLFKHLRHQRLITYCFGPRTTFYMRYYLRNLETHNISNNYAYGDVSESTIATDILHLLDRHMAFNRLAKKFDLEIKLTEDAYAKYRTLANRFKTNIPNKQTFNNTIMVRRYSKQTMHSRTLVKLTRHGANRDDYKALGLQPYHHMIVHQDKLIAYVWDTREIQAIVPIDSVDKKHLTYNVQDNRSDVIIRLSTPTDIREQIEQIREDLPVQFRDSADSVGNSGEE